VAALMLADTPGLTPTQLIARMRSGVHPFPTSSSTSSTQCHLADTTADSNGNYTDTSQNTECVCTTATCGAGMVDAAASLTEASGIFVQITTSSSTGRPGQRIQIDGSGSTASQGDTIVSYQWTTIPSTSDQIVDPTAAVTTLVVPSFRTIQVKLTIVDSGGHTASGSATIQSTFGAASGSGAFSPVWLFSMSIITALVLVRRLRDRRIR
jgi:serine protease